MNLVKRYDALPVFLAVFGLELYWLGLSLTASMGMGRVCLLLVYSRLLKLCLLANGRYAQLFAHGRY